MGFEDACKIIDIACRYDRILTRADLIPALAPTELAARLLAAHALIPLNLEGLLEAGDAEMVAEVGSIVSNYDRVNGCFRPGYRPKYIRYV
jgi:hypothetical protein